jgi:hypothetical protein
MSGDVLRFRAAYWGVVPGPEPEPGQDGRQPVGFEKTYDGMVSAITLAKHLSVGGPGQDVVLVRGRHVDVKARFEHGIPVRGPLLAPPDFRPASVTALREGAPHGHIQEVCTHKQHLAAGRAPRRSPNMPRTPAYKTTLEQIRQTIEQNTQT